MGLSGGGAFNLFMLILFNALVGFAYRVALTAGGFVFAPVLDLDPVHGAEVLHSRQPHHVLLHDFHVAVNVETRTGKNNRSLSLSLYDKALRRTRDICRGVCSKVPTTSLSSFFFFPTGCPGSR